jgi:hypothetical protein
MIGIALHMHYLRGDILGLVADGVDDDAAAHRAIRTGGARLSSPGDLQFYRLSVRGSYIKAEDRGDYSARANL